MNQVPFFKRTMPVLLSVAVTISAVAGLGNAATKPKPAVKPAASVQKTAGAVDAKAADKKAYTVPADAVSVEPLDLLKSPDQYLNKKVIFTGTFNRFADIALDYKKAFRDSRDYVTFFILRPDVKEHTIPLAELKLFYPRKKSDEVAELEPGDKITVVGTEFSNALGEPWVDVDHIQITQKTETPERKPSAPEF